eukprot:scaffold254190_cov35-Tisochrysis_lutea.AAC.1
MAVARADVDDDGQVLVRSAEDVWALHRWEQGAHGELVTADDLLIPVSHRAASGPAAQPCFLLLSLVEAFHLAFVQSRLRIFQRKAADDTSTGSRKRPAPVEHGSGVDESSLLQLDEARCWAAFCRIASRFPFDYAAYDHLLVNGWLVRSGLSFGADFSLYRPGPRVDHASHLVLVQAAGEVPRSWVFLQGHIRLCQQVAKRLVMCDVAWGEESSAPASGVNSNQCSWPSCCSVDGGMSIKSTDSTWSDERRDPRFHLLEVGGKDVCLSLLQVATIQLKMWSPARAHGETSRVNENDAEAE